MLDFIAKYWLQFIFSIVVGFLTCVTKYLYGLHKKEQSKQRDEVRESFRAEIALERQATSEAIEQEHKARVSREEALNREVKKVEGKIDSLQNGILSIQSRIFKSDCRKLLEPEHEITLEEYEQIVIEHQVYRDLGGNGRGDELFELVSHKFNSALIKPNSQ